VKTLIGLFYRISEVYHQIFKYPRKSAQIVIKTPKGIILVKPTYASQYYFPGGGIKMSEKPKQAAIREAKEELGINLIPINLKLFGKFTNYRYGWQDNIWLFTTNCRFPINPNHKNFEIHHYIFVNSQNFRKYNLSPATRRHLTEYYSVPQKHFSKNW